MGLKGLPEERAVELGVYIVEHGATVRQTAAVFGVSKSTVHTDDTKGNDFASLSDSKSTPEVFPCLRFAKSLLPWVS